ncbi:MAG: hypothetical protein OEW15_06090 [Nitrospirota bacterium]|nr:hypothetical protein [Nitrospirota bacterium]
MRYFLIAVAFVLSLVCSAFAVEPDVSGTTVDTMLPQVQTTFLPIGYLFTPLIADQKQPRFYVSYRR